MKKPKPTTATVRDLLAKLARDQKREEKQLQVLTHKYIRQAGESGLKVLLCDLSNFEASLRREARTEFYNPELRNRLLRQVGLLVVARDLIKNHATQEEEYL